MKKLALAAVLVLVALGTSAASGTTPSWTTYTCTTVAAGTPGQVCLYVISDGALAVSEFKIERTWPGNDQICNYAASLNVTNGGGKTYYTNNGATTSGCTGAFSEGGLVENDVTPTSVTFTSNSNACATFNENEKSKQVATTACVLIHR